MSVFGALGKMAGKVKDSFANVVNEEELDACVAACVLMAAADGTISDAEKEMAFKSISTHESLKSFNKDKIRASFDSDANLINSDRELATQVLEDKIRKVSEMTARIRIIGIAKQIAAADGVFSKEEEAVVNRIRRITG